MRVIDGGPTVLAVGDGAGSAPLAAEGSAIAVTTASDAIVGGASMEEAFEAAAGALLPDAGRKATTLLVAVLDDPCVTVGQVGDGFIVARSSSTYRLAVPEVEREYLNETTFLSSTTWRDDFRCAVLDDADGVALFTDGLQLVAMELATSTPYAGFFDPVFRWVESGDATAAELEEFLASPRLAERTDDDVTLAIAVCPPG